MSEQIQPDGTRVRTFVVKRRLRKDKTKEEIENTVHLTILFLRDVRKMRGITQRQFAEKTGYSYVHISDIERGHVIPKFQTVVDMANALGYDIECVEKED